MNKSWSIREYNDGDEEKINSLLNQVYKLDRSLSHWYWEFLNNPEGFNTLLAVDENHIIGHLAALKRKINIGELEIPASIEVEGVTHPKYGRQGIFVSLGEKLLSDLEKEHIALVYGFPNENALHGHRKLNCIELFKLHVMIRPLNFKKVSEKSLSNKISRFFAIVAGRITFSLFYRPKKPRIESGVEIKMLDEFDSRFDDFWKKAQAHFNIILKRDSKYLNWRFIRNPSRKYEVFVALKDEQILAWIIVRVFERYGLKNGAIVDMLALPESKGAAQALIHTAIEHFKQKDVDLMACSIPKWSDYYTVLKKCGFATCPKKLNPKEESFIVYPLSTEIDIDFVKKGTNWYITWGDTDVV